MKLHNATALALVAVGAAHLVQRERHQWQQNEAVVMRNQLDWLTHLTTHPEVAQLWAPEDVQVEEYTKLLHANQLICALSLRHKLGLLRGRRLRYAPSGSWSGTTPAGTGRGSVPSARPRPTGTACSPTSPAS